MSKLNFSRPSLKMKDDFRKHLAEINRYVDDGRKLDGLNKLTEQDLGAIFALLDSIDKYYVALSNHIKGPFGRKKKSLLRETESEMRESIRSFALMILEEAFQNGRKMQKRHEYFLEFFSERMKNNEEINEIVREEMQKIEKALFQ